jgi:hypothetical protein
MALGDLIILALAGAGVCYGAWLALSRAPER